VIFGDKLQGKTKKLLKDRNDMCAKILENIHSNYRSLETGELMREVTDPSSNFLSSRQLPKEDFSKNITNVAHAMNALPHNINNLLPRTYYSRFREWYSHMVIPEAIRSYLSKQWFLSFKFVTLCQSRSKENKR